MPRDTVQILTTEGVEMVRADVFDGLAVHRGVNGRGMQNVTHLRSGKAVVRDLTRAEAMAFVIRTKFIDWKADEATLRGYRCSIQDAIKDIYGARQAPEMQTRTRSDERGADLKAMQAMQVGAEPVSSRDSIVEGIAAGV